MRFLCFRTSFVDDESFTGRGGRQVYFYFLRQQFMLMHIKEFSYEADKVMIKYDITEQDLKELTGTGLHGQLVAEDIENVIETRPRRNYRHIQEQLGY